MGPGQKAPKLKEIYAHHGYAMFLAQALEGLLVQAIYSFVIFPSSEEEITHIVEVGNKVFISSDTRFPNELEFFLQVSSANNYSELKDVLKAISSENVSALPVTKLNLTAMILQLNPKTTQFKSMVRE